MNAKIVNYVRGRKTQTRNEAILALDDPSKATSLTGHSVRLTISSGTLFVGRVIGKRGSKGCVVARFSRGLPGEALGCAVEIA